jgi:hypothetical protein
VRAADLLTQAAQALSRYTEGLTKEAAAQAKGEPSPGGEDERRRLNRLFFGEDSSEGGLDLIKKKLGWLMHPSQWVGPSEPTASPSGAFPVAHIPVGRDPRSPSTGPNAYFPPQGPAQSQGPQAVNVQGQAAVEHEITVRIEASPLLQAIVDQARQQSETTIPLIGGGLGAMDSDAAPHRSGGIGKM